MDNLALWIGIVIGTGLVLALVIVPARPARRIRQRADIRREWTQARPNWGGSDGWEGRE